MVDAAFVDEGTLPFTIEGRILRELGERLVRQPDVALVELLKNAYDADATKCTVTVQPGSILVEDDGLGMDFDSFKSGWMRIGTSSKADKRSSTKFGRPITGEKGIGRFAVRFLGAHLHLETTAFDATRGHHTRIVADFDWPSLDVGELANVEVPYRVERVAEADPRLGTCLLITSLRPGIQEIDFSSVRSNSLAVVSPLRTLLTLSPGDSSSPAETAGLTARTAVDPGFSISLSAKSDETADIAALVLDAFTLRAVLKFEDGMLDLRVFRRGTTEPVLKIRDKFDSRLDNTYADIRFFPRRSGSFSGLGLDGRKAYAWIKSNSGVAVFDRGFRVAPYGRESDDWLRLQADAARNYRAPRSTIADRHFPIGDGEKSDTSENWMLRLPQSAQLVGVVQVAGTRSSDDGAQDGLIAAADREGFIENRAFVDLVNLVRGSVEAIAYCDRQLQREEQETKRLRNLEKVRAETRDAIQQIQADRAIPAATKRYLVDSITATAEAVESTEKAAREREQQLEIMSLLGVVAGFMTHEFGSAIVELEEVASEIEALQSQSSLPDISPTVTSLRRHIVSLQQYVQYSTAYIKGSGAGTPEKAYPVLPRIKQVVRVFGQYATDRDIDVEVSVDRDLPAPPVPAALYNGVALNLFTNALKAVTGSPRDQPVVAIRSWNERGTHHLQVSDTGIGIPSVLRERVFDPLFTTTASRDDPLGSGMGLGLSLVRRAVEAFGGKVEVVDPPPGFTTSFQVRIPLTKGHDD